MSGSRNQPKFNIFSIVSEPATGSPRISKVDDSGPKTELIKKPKKNQKIEIMVFMVDIMMSLRIEEKGVLDSFFILYLLNFVIRYWSFTHYGGWCNG